MELVVQPHEDWEVACERAMLDPSEELYSWTDVAKLTHKSVSRMQDQKGWENGVDMGRRRRGYTKAQVIAFSKIKEFPARESEALLRPGLTFSVAEAAEHLRLDAKAVERFIAKGELEEVGGRIHCLELARFVAAQHGQIQEPRIFLDDNGFALDGIGWQVVYYAGGKGWRVVWAGEPGYIT